jgi:protein AroM
VIDLKIGFLTIGQSPRHDILEEIFSQTQRLEVIEAGALDNLSTEQIAMLKPVDKDETLVSRLRNGQQVTISKKRLIPLLNEAIKRLHLAGADIALLLCTDTFEITTTPIPLIQPGRIMRTFVGSILSENGKLGLVVPLEAQIRKIKDNWVKFVSNIKAIAFSPYLDNKPSLEELRSLTDRDLIVMDCMGYRIEHERLIRMYTKRPVFLPKRLISLLIEEFYQV